MAHHEMVVADLHGLYHDVLRDQHGRVILDRGWHSNVIVVDCRRLLAGFMRGQPITLGIQGLRVGIGSEAWDQAPATPTPGQTGLVDPNPATVPVSDLQIDFLDNGTATGTPTNRIQIVAALGPGVPPWPDVNHPTATLREFGLFGQLDGADVLINYVIHPAIVKDPSSTLERTIWLVF
jgi:hypothetical protein